MENSDSSNTPQIKVDGAPQTLPRSGSSTASSQAGTKQPSGADAPRSRRLSRLLFLGVGGVAALIFGYRWWHFAATHETTDDAYVTGHLHQLNARINGNRSEGVRTCIRKLEQSLLL